MKLVKVVALGFLTCCLSLPAFAAGIEKPECIAPAKPGGGFDLTCRVAQTGLKDHLPKLMQVTFMPGGIGAVAFNLFNTTRTDDPNAIVAFSSGSLLNIATGKYGKWSASDVRWLATAGADFGAVVVKGDSKYKTLDDLMADFKKGENTVTVGAGGSVGSQDWMKAALLLKSVDKDPRKCVMSLTMVVAMLLPVCWVAVFSFTWAMLVRWFHTWVPALCVYWRLCLTSACLSLLLMFLLLKNLVTMQSGPSCVVSTWVKMLLTKLIMPGLML